LDFVAFGRSAISDEFLHSVLENQTKKFVASVSGNFSDFSQFGSLADSGKSMLVRLALPPLPLC
jgi:hypothetical protein